MHLKTVRMHNLSGKQTKNKLSKILQLQLEQQAQMEENI